MTFTTLLFYILASVLVIAAIRVITARSPITAVLHLILAFLNAAMLWMLLGAEFLALLLILVYVGAVMVLFLFVVMMLDVRMESLRTRFRSYLPLGLSVGLILVLEMSFVLARTWLAWDRPVAMAGDYNNARVLGTLMYTQYSFAVEIAAVLLLVAMIAAITLTLRHRQDVKPNLTAQAIHVQAKDRVQVLKMSAVQRERNTSNPTHTRQVEKNSTSVSSGDKA